MALYTKESKDRVRDAVDFLELVSARTELRRAGPARYEGLCPFHDERTPSFGIDPEQKVYYCFGCQASGDVFTFVQETEGVDFKGALELLAERAGVELQREAEDPREAERRMRRERLLQMLDRTCDYYVRYLWESKEAERAREYLLRERGLDEQTLREFRVGYAPSAWDKVLNASRRGGYSNRDIYDAGLVQRSRQNGQLYDRFRSRIMFPLADMRGHVLGFGARASSDEQQPKYLNTSDNDVYHKGLHLYGANLARAHAARAGQVILCEGYTDVIALHQAGMRNAVGLMGTALTAQQVGELARMAQTVLLALDSDTAGQEAMLKAARLAASRKLELRVVPLPAGADPAELIAAQGGQAVEQAVSRSVPFVRFQVERVLEGGDRDSAEGRDRILDELRPVFAALAQSASRMELLRLVASTLAEQDTLIERELSKPRRQGAGPPAPDAPAARRARGAGLSRREETEHTFLALCIALPDEGERALRELDVEAHFSGELMRRAVRRLRDGSLREPMAAAEGDEDLRPLLAELVVEAGGLGAHPTMLEVQRLQLELARLDRDIQQARGREDADVSALATRRGEVKHDFDVALARRLEETGAREG